MGVPCREVEATADLTGSDILVVGKGALTVDGPGPDVSRVRDGTEGHCLRAEPARCSRNDSASASPSMV